MTIGVGVDIITITRMKDILDTSEKAFLNKVFTPWESNDWKHTRTK